MPTGSPSSSATINFHVPSTVCAVGGSAISVVHPYAAVKGFESNALGALRMARYAMCFLLLLIMHTHRLDAGQIFVRCSPGRMALALALDLAGCIHRCFLQCF